MNSTYKVRGMTCNHCKEKIEKALENKQGVKYVKVELKSKRMHIRYNPKQINLHEIKKIIVELGYELVEEKQSDEEVSNKLWLTIAAAVGIFFIMNSIVPDFSKMLGSGEELGLAMLVIIGVTTSFHCVSMCGGIALAQVTKETNNFKRNIMYNLGRVISYTLLGGIVGVIGSGITLGNRFFSIVPILLGIIMIFVGLGNAGVLAVGNIKGMQRFNLKLVKIRSVLSHDQGPFVLGLVNGLMPCGPLQLMQIYALSTGNFVDGALAMFAFSIGTVPMMLGLGVFINRISVASKELVFKMGGYLVVLLGISMAFNGMASMGINTSLGSNKVTKDNINNKTIMEDGYQVITINAGPRSYGDIVVQKDVPVRMIINVKPGELTFCNYAINVPEYGIFANLQEGENVFEFTPTGEGTYIYSCWMGMIRNTITVVEGDVSDYVPEINPFSTFGGAGGFSCH